MPQRLDIYDLRDAWAGVRSVAMVGNAATILQRQNGALIDSHDLVIRFNRARIEGLEDRIGRRTDLLVANAANSLEKAPSPAGTLKPRWVLCFVQPQVTADLAPFRAWVGDIPTVVTLSPDILEFATTGRTRGLTLGTYTLYTLLKLLPLESLFVTGFTMYGAAGGDSQKYYDPGSRAGSYHDLDEEARLFSAILASFEGRLEVTPEVADVLRRHGHAGRLEDAADAGGVVAPSLYYRLLGRLAWRFLRTGFKLRRRFEQGTSIQFDSLKR